MTGPAEPPPRSRGRGRRRRFWASLGLLAATISPVVSPAAAVTHLSRPFGTTLDHPALVESSGLAVSQENPGVLWSHNDSGDGPLLYAFNRDGRPLATLRLLGAEQIDWEDLALVPAAAGSGPTLIVADVGDNGGVRGEVALYRVAEPILDPDGSKIQALALPAARVLVRYEDGPHDAEALLVHPTTGETLIVAKRADGIAPVYRVPVAGAEQPVTAQLVAEVGLPGPAGRLGGVTGGAVAPDGGRLALRTPLAAFDWAVPPGASLADALAGRPATRLLPPFPLGEAIAYAADGASLLGTSEGAPCPLFEVDLPADPGFAGTDRPARPAAGSSAGSRSPR